MPIPRNISKATCPELSPPSTPTPIPDPDAGGACGGGEFVFGGDFGLDPALAPVTTKTTALIMERTEKIQGKKVWTIQSV